MILFGQMNIYGLLKRVVIESRILVLAYLYVVSSGFACVQFLFLRPGSLIVMAPCISWAVGDGKVIAISYYSHRVGVSDLLLMSEQCWKADFNLLTCDSLKQKGLI